MFPLRLPGSRFLAAALLAAAALGSGPSSMAGSAPKLPPLTTVARNPRLPGKFVWADLVTDNLPAAQKFYTQLFHWEFHYGGYYNDVDVIVTPPGPRPERPVARPLPAARPVPSVPMGARPMPRER